MVDIVVGLSAGVSVAGHRMNGNVRLPVAAADTFRSMRAEESALSSKKVSSVWLRLHSPRTGDSRRA